MDRLKFAFVALLVASPAAAQQCGTLTTCPPVSTPLAGTELLYTVQGGVSKKMTVTQLGLALGPYFALTPGVSPIVPTTNGGLLWDNNGKLADSLAPLQTALPSLAANQIYGGTGAAGAAQAFPPGAGVPAWLITPTSANLAAAVTDETGTGPLVFANSPSVYDAKYRQRDWPRLARPSPDGWNIERGPQHQSERRDDKSRLDCHANWADDWLKCQLSKL